MIKIAPTKILTTTSNEPGKPIMVEIHASGVRPSGSNFRGDRIYHGFGKTVQEAEDDALAQLSAFLLYGIDDDEPPVW